MTGVPIPARPTPPAIDQPLWALVRDDRQLVAVARQHPGVQGFELVISIDGAMRWAHYFRAAADLQREADIKRAQLVERGWQPAM